MRDKRELHKSTSEYDAMLDAALQTYAGAAPREGLETRILARTAESVHAPRPVFGRLLAFSGVALLVLLCISAPTLLRHKPDPPAAPQFVKTNPAPPSISQPQTAEFQKAALPKTIRKPRPRAPQAVASGKPLTPVPLSSQERMLLQLAASPQKPLANLNKFEPVEIAPIQISALHIQPLSDSATPH